jgi:undecaprenyl-diphosphatase
MASMPRKDNTFLFGLRYQIASELAFYTPGRPRTVSINKWRRPNAYDYWWNDKDLMGWDAVGIVVDYKRHILQLQDAFEYVSPPERIAIYRTGASVSGETPDPPVSEYYLYRAFGFKGGVKWMPPDTFDMRAN